MNKLHVFVAVIAISLVNGLPINVNLHKILYCRQVVSLLVPEIFHGDARWLLYFNALFLSTLTLFVSGVPAALYERLWLGERDSIAPMFIWLAGAALLTIPTFYALGSS